MKSLLMLMLVILSFQFPAIARAAGGWTLVAPGDTEAAPLFKSIEGAKVCATELVRKGWGPICNVALRAGVDVGAKVAVIASKSLGARVYFNVVVIDGPYTGVSGWVWPHNVKLGG